MDLRGACRISAAKETEYRYVFFKKSFKLDENPQKATIAVCSDFQFAFFANGERVQMAAFRSNPLCKEYSVYDISEQLKTGSNTLGFLCHESKSACVLGVKTGFVAKVRLEYASKISEIVTDESWLCKKADWYIETPFTMSNGEFHERFDSRLFDDDILSETSNDGFSAVCVEENEISVKQREIKYHKTEKTNAPCIWQGKDDGKICSDDKNPSIAFNENKISGDFCNVQESEFNNKQNNIFVFDFGKTRTIFPSIKINTVKGDVRIELFYNENIAQRPKAYRGFGTEQEGFCDIYIPSCDGAVWQALSSKGMRFAAVRIAGEGYASFTPLFKTQEYPFDDEKKPDLQNEVLSKAWDIATETIKSSTTDFYVDTCARENALWTLDSSIIGRAAYDTFGETALWKRTLLNIGYGIDENGKPQTMAYPYGNMELIDQAFSWVKYCKEYYDETKDFEFLKEVFPIIKRLMNYAKGFVTVEGLFMPPKKSWHWVDWAFIDRRPYSLPVNALYVIAMEEAADIANECGDTSEKLKYKAEAESVRKKAEKFYDENEKAFLTHIEPETEVGEYNTFTFKEEDKAEMYKYSIHANGLAIRAGIGTYEQQKTTADFIVSQYKKFGGAWFEAGPGWIDSLLSPLLDFGMKEEVEEILSNYIKPRMHEGQPTFGETWGATLYNSGHGWGGAINTLLKKLEAKKPNGEK